MTTIKKGLIGFSCLAFLLAVVASLITDTIMQIPPESFSRACSNLALISIALSVGLKRGS